MKRAQGHTAFAIVTVALAALTASECLSFQHAQSINAAVAEWSKATKSDLHTAASPGPGVAPSDPRAADHLPAEARLARAVALAKVDYDGALAAYKSITQSSRDDLRLIALYDLGNLHLHQAIQYGLADEAQSLPLTELAKQSYRDLLRRDPTDWDARYNLERALRLAPEDDDEADEDTGPPDPREHERSTIADPRMDLP